MRHDRIGDVRLQLTMTTGEWTIYPNGLGSFALGSQDGCMLYSGEMVEIRLGGTWIAGFIEQHTHTDAQFVAAVDGMPCGLCAGMKIRVSRLQVSAGGVR